MADPVTPAQFRPAGFEFSSDEEDDHVDNFCFGVSSLDGNSNINQNKDTSTRPDPEAHEVTECTGNGTGNTTSNLGGFGVPPGYVPKHHIFGLPAGAEGHSSGTKHAPAALKPKRKEHPHTKQVSTQSKPIPLEDFKTAAVRGNLEELEKFFNQGVSINEVLRSGWTVLMYAGNCANVKAVTFLLNKGANANYHTDHYTVLMAVCASISANQDALCQCAKLLIDQGVDVNHVDRYHISPLMYAARNNKGQLIKLLVNAGALKDKQDNRGYTALSWAACQGHIRAVHVLLEAGADSNKLSNDGSTAADLAVVSGHEHIASIINRFGKGDTLAALTQLDSMASDEKLTQEDQDDCPYTSQSCEYGALEMFLLDAELGKLITTFQQNHVTFEAFLRFTDNDFQQLGITQLGTRKKLLSNINATHKQTWDSTSLPSIQYNKLVTCPESVAMIMNLSNHAAYMATSAGYMADQLRSHPEILTEAKDGTMVLDLSNRTDEALAKVRVLYNELVILRKAVSKEISQTNFEAVDIIKSPKAKRKGLRTRRLVLVGFVMLVGVTVWKRKLLPQLLESAWCLVRQRPAVH